MRRRHAAGRAGAALTLTLTLTLTLALTLTLTLPLTLTLTLALTLQAGLEPLCLPLLSELNVLADSGRGGGGRTHARRRPCHAARGRAWALLGLLRWRLLLPRLGVDPACKYALKAAVLAARLQAQRLERRAGSLAQQGWNGAKRSAELSAQAASLRGTRAALEHAAERSSARPATPNSNPNPHPHPHPTPSLSLTPNPAPNPNP